MTTQTALLAAINARPDDDTPRLAYADYLDDHAGDGPDPDGWRARAEFIREAIAHPAYEFVTLTRTGGDPLPLLGLPSGPWAWGEWESLGSVIIDEQRGLRYSVRRGFVDAVGATAADWLAHADAILAAHPVRRVRLTTFPEYDWHTTNAPPYRMTCRLPGRARRVEVWEQEIMRAGRAGALEPGVGALATDTAARLLALEWPGVEFEIPPPLQTASWESAARNPLADLQAARRMIDRFDSRYAPRR